MNSEELEQSLRAEFEQHLKQVFADVREEVSALQEQVEQEFDRHRAQLVEAFESFSSRAAGSGDESEKELDAGFRASIVEHLRLARDEGARITATAIAEAEAMEKEAAAAAAAEEAPKVAGIAELRDGIDDICAQASQAAILKSLVAHAEQFTPRGAFFIVKNEHLVGWRVFGRDEQDANADATVREIFFPVANQTSLGESLKSLSAVEAAAGDYAGDSVFLEKLEFGAPEKMVAIPLVARGRGVAVLYADRGANGETGGGEVNVEALETLVRVAGLTVEVLAANAVPTQAPGAKQSSSSSSSSAGAARQTRDYASPESSEEDYQRFEEAAVADDERTSEPETVDYAAQVEASGASAYEVETSADEYSGAENYQTENAEFDSTANDYSLGQSTDASEEAPIEAEEIQPVYQAEEQQQQTESYSWNRPAEQDAPDASENESYSNAGSQYQFEQTQTYDAHDAPELASPQYEGASETARDFKPAAATSEENYGAFESQNGGAATQERESLENKPAQEVVEPAAAAKPARGRFSDRNIDLPVEVGEDERRLHNDARRFARLLVSEIKLYNEQKVKEGRDGSDLYDRLREAIDRSREMYDKRVQPQVAAKFDYFHYELVNSLAEGDEAKLGNAYAGATV